MTSDNVPVLALHDRSTYEVIEVDPRFMVGCESLTFEGIGTFTRVTLMHPDERGFVDVQEPVDLIKRTLQLGFSFDTHRKTASRRHP